jgi:hypothetical protein
MTWQRPGRIRVVTDRRSPRAAGVDLRRDHVTKGEVVGGPRGSALVAGSRPGYGGRARLAGRRRVTPKLPTSAIRSSRFDAVTRGPRTARGGSTSTRTSVLWRGPE